MSSNQEMPVLKILLIGESAVGKSCLLLRYTEDIYHDSGMATIGVDFKTKYVDIDGKRAKLQIYDTSGQEKFRAITKAYYRGAHGVLVVFDVSRRDTFNLTKFWLDSIRDSADVLSPTVDVVLIGNKCDLERFVSEDEAEELASQYKIRYFETSAKDNTNVSEAFNYLATLAYRNFTGANKGKTLNLDGNNGEKKCNC